CALGAPLFQVDIAAGIDAELDQAVAQSALEAADALFVAAVETVGEAQNRNQHLYHVLLFSGERLISIVHRVGQRFAVITAESGDEQALALGESGHVGVGDHVVGMLVVSGGGDEMSDIVQAGCGFENFAGLRRELVERLQGMEKQASDVGYLAGVLNRN